MNLCSEENQEYSSTETNPDIKVSGTFEDYHTLLTKRLDYLQKMLQYFKLKHVALLNKDMEYFQ